MRQDDLICEGEGIDRFFRDKWHADVGENGVNGLMRAEPEEKREPEDQRARSETYALRATTARHAQKGNQQTLEPAQHHRLGGSDLA